MDFKDLWEPWCSRKLPSFLGYILGKYGFTLSGQLMEKTQKFQIVYGALQTFVNIPHLTS